jgi:hypothetical protein
MRARRRAPPPSPPPCACRSTPQVPLRRQPLDHGHDALDLVAFPHAAAPGRVDSPPTSIIAAPADRHVDARRAARGRIADMRPPSEKLSGVTLRMPITCG